MAQALVLPLLERGDFAPEHVFAVVRSCQSLDRLSSQLPRGLGLVIADDSSAAQVWSAPIQILAVKPQQLNTVVDQASEHQSFETSSRPVLISLLAGVSLNRLQNCFPTHVCVRAVPNTPSLVAAGLTGISWGDQITNQQKVSVKKIFSPISELFELPESQIDAFLALTSSGPAYVAVMIEALADGAVAAGLPRKIALHLAVRTLGGTASLLKEKQMHPGQLKDMVASPGGTTIAALRHLEKAGIRSALIEAVLAAADRSRELA